MKSSSQPHLLADNFIDSRRFILGLRHALDVSYERVLDAARAQWEQHLEGNDPSDACVSVRITSGKPTAGVIRKPATSLLYGAHRLTA
ncbi:MAG: hypothetical protein WAO00_14210 [Chthoniobacterales bacterium]